jgi:hypothetical protein
MKAGGDGAVLPGYEIVKEAGPGSGTYAAGIEQVFKSHRDAVKSPPITSSIYLRLSSTGSSLGLLWQQGDEGVQHFIGRLDA